ncbi:MAG: serine hydrolase [Clostridia bacterium]
MMKRDAKGKSKDKGKKTLMAIAIIFITISIPVISVYVHRYLKTNTNNSSLTPQMDSTIPTDIESDIQSESDSSSSTGTNQPTEPSISSEINLNELEIRSIYSLKLYLEYLLETNEGRYGLSLYNLDTEEYIGINDMEPYVAASSTKVPMVMYVYDAVEQGYLSFEDIVEYLESDYEAGTGIIIKGKFGDKYTIGQLVEYAIIYSDNCAINMLIRTCNEWNMVNYMNNLGAKIDYIQKRWKTCPYDLMLYYKELFSLIERNPEHYQKLMDDLCMNTVAYQMSSKSILPDELKVAMKVGINTTLPTFNETTAVFADQIYILSYCSTDIDIDESSATLKKISQTIFEYIENGYVLVELNWK